METSSPNTSDDGAHLDAFVMPDLDGGVVDQDAPRPVDADGNVLDLEPSEPAEVDKDGFWVLFQTAFDLPGQMLPELQPMGIQPNEHSKARAASDATHDLLRIWYPAALVPNSETIAHLMIAGPFFIGKAMVVRGLLAARKTPPPTAAGPAAPPIAPSPAGPAQSDSWHLRAAE